MQHIPDKISQIQRSLSARSIAQRWDCHPTTVLRICVRFGYSGIKFGSGRANARRFEIEQIKKIEKARGLHQL